MSSSEQESNRLVVRKQLEFDQLIGVEEISMARSTSKKLGTAKSSTSSAASVDSSTVVERKATLEVIDASEVKSCRKCQLCETRTHTVFGQGAADARLVFVGEAPGYDEDQSGLAFVGRAGQLLTKMIDAMGLSREDVFICNVLKCRPPNNRNPTQAEIVACSPYLFRQLQILQPQVICTLGAPASQTLLATSESIGRLRGRFHDFYISGTAGDGTAVPLMPTYHPAYLLRAPGEKSKAWADLQLIMQKMGLPTKKA